MYLNPIGGIQLYRKDDFKLIEYLVNGERNTQLFNLKEDPIEFNNFFGDEKFQG